VSLSICLPRKRILVRVRTFEGIGLLIGLLLLMLLGKVFAPLKPGACILRIPNIHGLLAFETRDLGWVIERSAHLGVAIPLSNIGSGGGGGGSGGGSRVE